MENKHQNLIKSNNSTLVKTMVTSKGHQGVDKIIDYNILKYMFKQNTYHVRDKL
jgi:hypothetical protein